MSEEEILLSSDDRRMIDAFVQRAATERFTDIESVNRFELEFRDALSEMIAAKIDGYGIAVDLTDDSRLKRLTFELEEIASSYEEIHIEIVESDSSTRSSIVGQEKSVPSRISLSWMRYLLGKNNRNKLVDPIEHEINEDLIEVRLKDCGSLQKKIYLAQVYIRYVFSVIGIFLELAKSPFGKLVPHAFKVFWGWVAVKIFGSG